MLVRRAVINALVEPFITASCRVIGILPDFLALPYTPGHWSLAADGQQIIVRTGICRGFTIEIDAFDTVASKFYAGG
ncbi:MAG: hypothetical protein EXR86_06805 [Gammaproteobacteria bacterium]|nr:hypothetical protein [Gammaproteobacteria bacterium]